MRRVGWGGLMLRRRRREAQMSYKEQSLIMIPGGSQGLLLDFNELRICKIFGKRCPTAPNYETQDISILKPIQNNFSIFSGAWL